MAAPMAPTTPPKSPAENLMLGLPASERATHIIDNFLAESTQRELISSGEITNLLLDLRIIITGDQDGYPNPTQEN